jgi:MFS family permease
MLLNLMFALAGIGWASINVNGFPMVVELCRGGDVGRYTGFYYTASMAAQTVTPYFSGMLMDKMGMTVLFPYATVFVALAFVTMLFRIAVPIGVFMESKNDFNFSGVVLVPLLLIAF